MKKNLREWSTRYQCFIRPKVVPEFSFKMNVTCQYNLPSLRYQINQLDYMSHNSSELRANNYF